MNIYRSKPARAAFLAAALLGTLLGGHRASAQSQAPSPPAALAAAVASQNLSASGPTVDIHDIRGPKPIASPWLVPLIVTTVLLAIGGAYAAWIWNRRRFREASKRPLDIALDRLERARCLIEPPRGREFSIEVSSAIRIYIEARFDIRAAHLTTDEFLHHLLDPADSALSAHRSELDHFLASCDLAKFGGWTLGAVDMNAMLQSAHQFIVASSVETRSDRPSTSLAATTAANQSSMSTSRETYVPLPSA